jgi:metal-responsive CopG/Arc/MetJ family transcriptional regulator
MLTVGRMSVSFSEDYKDEYNFLQNLPNKSKFICEAIKKCLEDTENLSPIEKFIKSQMQ